MKSAVLARRAGVSRGYVGRLLSGTCDPTRGMMIKIAAAMSWLIQEPVTVVDLFELTFTTPRAEMLQALRDVTYETDRMLGTLDRAEATAPADRWKEARRSVILIREKAAALHELIRETWER